MSTFRRTTRRAAATLLVTCGLLTLGAPAYAGDDGGCTAKTTFENLRAKTVHTEYVASASINNHQSGGADLTVTAAREKEVRGYIGVGLETEASANAPLFRVVKASVEARFGLVLEAEMWVYRGESVSVTIHVQPWKYVTASSYRIKYQVIGDLVYTRASCKRDVTPDFKVNAPVERFHTAVKEAPSYDETNLMTGDDPVTTASEIVAPPTEETLLLQDVSVVETANDALATAAAYNGYVDDAVGDPNVHVTIPKITT